jgi:hypothetical protein
MTSTPEELGKQWNIGFNSSDVNELLSLITDDYVSTINGDNIGNFEDHFKDMIYEYNIRWFRSAVISTIKVNETEVLSMGPWIIGLTNNKTQKKEYWKGNWSDIRIKCSDDLWRIKVSVISKTINLWEQNH